VGKTKILARFMDNKFISDSQPTIGVEFSTKIIPIKIKGKTLLEYHIERSKWSELPLIVATTTNNSDDCVVDLCKKLNILFFRGDENDVLSRYFLAARENKLKTVIRVTSDCPLIDGNLVRKALQSFTDCDYLSNSFIRTYPSGFDFEIFSFSALEKAYYNAVESSEREHVTPYIYHTHKHLFRIKPFVTDNDNSRFRITVDTEDDFKLIKEMIENFECDRLTADEIITVLQKNSYLKDINAHVTQRKCY